MPLVTGGYNSLKHISPALLNRVLAHTHPEPTTSAPTAAANVQPPTTTASTPTEASTPASSAPDHHLTEPMAH